MVKTMRLGMGILLLVFLVLLSGVGIRRLKESRDTKAAGNILQGQMSPQEPRYRIAVDSGHGGMDPGRVNEDGVLEKDINLDIALRVKRLLEANDVEVIMTREDDSGLYEETDSNKKMADLRARCAKINESNVDVAVSIHQNSFEDPEVCGAQMFYYHGSPEGERLALELQEQFGPLSPNNTREIKSNTNYYILLHVNCPMVVAECGFLSNPGDAALLGQEEYREKIAFAVVMGVLRYLNQGNGSEEILQ